jgi:DNA-binding transcriptional LysR family regulator
MNIINKTLKNLNLKKLQIFLNLVTYGSLKETTRNTGISKKKIKELISEIEKNIDDKIILKESENHKIIFTSSGEKIFETAKKIIEITKNKKSSNPDKETDTNLSIACLLQFSHYFLPYAIRKYKEKYPNSLITISQYHHYHTPSILKHDIVIGMGAQTADDLSQHFINTFTYGYYASQKYLEKHGVPQNLNDFKNHTFIENQGIDINIENPKIIVRSDSYFNINEFVLNGLGISSLCNEEVNNNDKFSPLVRILPDIITDSISIKLKFSKLSNKKKLILNMLKHCEESISELWTH